jgi:Trk K+ transport system NAD-binding subunit
VRREGTPLFVGDARREALLGDANVRKAKSIILATDDDLANLETALDARRVAPEIRVVLRMFDQNMADKIRDGFNIHIAMSPAALSASAFATAAIDETIVNSFVVDGHLVVMQRWKVQEGGPLDGRSVGDVLSTMGFGIVEHSGPDGRMHVFPGPDILLRAGDRLVVQGPFDALSELRKKTAELVDSRDAGEDRPGVASAGGSRTA